MNILPGNLRFGAGQPVKRLEDQRLLTGKGQFIDDKPDEGALWLYVLRSPHAHARIVSIDTGVAELTSEAGIHLLEIDSRCRALGCRRTLASWRRSADHLSALRHRRCIPPRKSQHILSNLDAHSGLFQDDGPINDCGRCLDKIAMSLGGHSRPG